ncbi:glycoside hydrolase family protein, partial [Helicobacter winghamensis]|uniref:glycoside hydrolase family protein n=1 Tax=Helicobacter winghamensis TaxID=157268 RepID=UPI003C6D2DB7
MHTKNEVIEIIAPLTADFEGFSAKVYKCPAGFNTIGYGRNIEANPLNAQELAQLQNGEVSKEVALVWLKEELERCYERLNKLSWFKELDKKRAAAMVDMCYKL